MTTTISDGTSTLTAAVMDGYTATRRGRNVVHAILGSNAPAVSLRDAALRTGSHRLVFASQSVAEAACAMLGSGVEVTIDDTGQPAVNMTFVVPSDGDISIELDATRKAWIVKFDYQETD